MKIAVVILCRYSSKRLPGKVLMDIGGQPLLKRIYARLQKIIPDNQIIVATSDDSSDDIIETFCRTNEIQCFRGSLHNVSDRFLQAARTLESDFVIRINGDNLFIELDVLNDMIDICRSDKYDFVTNVVGRTFPYGMSVEIVRVSFYSEVLSTMRRKDYLEHVTLALYENSDLGHRYIFTNNKFLHASGLKLAIDTEQDLCQAKKMIAYLGDDHENYEMQDILEAYEHTL